MVILFLMFAGICAIAMILLGIHVLMAVVGAIAKVLSVIANIDEDSALRIIVVLLEIALFTMVVLSCI